MATLAHLIADGKLKKHEPDMEDFDQPTRFVYLSCNVDIWLGTILKAAPRDRGRDLNPHEQVEDLLYGFITGRPMTYGYHYKPLSALPQKDASEGSVWELRTTDVRLIGWFPRRATFLAVCGCLKKDIASAKLYKPYIIETRKFRDEIDIDPPKAIVGDLPSHVL